MLARLTGIIGDLGGNIFEINHQRLFNEMTVKMAEVDVVVEARGLDHVRGIIMALNKGGFPSKLLD
jgi:threonine dehydratase